MFVNVEGGGVQGQADAVRHGLARALAKTDSALEAVLREAGFTRIEATPLTMGVVTVYVAYRD